MSNFVVVVVIVVVVIVVVVIVVVVLTKESRKVQPLLCFSYKVLSMQRHLKENLKILNGC